MDRIKIKGKIPPKPLPQPQESSLPQPQSFPQPPNRLLSPPHKQSNKTISNIGFIPLSLESHPQDSAERRLFILEPPGIIYSSSYEKHSLQFPVSCDKVTYARSRGNSTFLPSVQIRENM